MTAASNQISIACSGVERRAAASSAAARGTRMTPGSSSARRRRLGPESVGNCVAARDLHEQQRERRSDQRDDEGVQRHHASSRSTPARARRACGASTATTSIAVPFEQRAHRDRARLPSRARQLGDLDDLAATVRAAGNLHDHVDGGVELRAYGRERQRRHHRAIPASRAGRGRRPASSRAPSTANRRDRC